MKTEQATNDFSAGEISSEGLERKDSRAVQNGLKRGRNIRLRDGGGFSRRPGSWKIALPEFGKRGIGYSYDDDNRYSLIFSDGRMDAFDAPEGTAKGSITDAPWTDGQIWELSFAPIDDRIFVSHRDAGFWVITRVNASSWSWASVVYDDGPGGSLLQPYYRYAAKGIAVAPTALTGSITLDFSDDVLVEDHEGTRFRYLGKEVEIGTYNNPQQALTSTVIQELPGSFTISVEDSTGFQVGHLVEGDETGATAYVTSIPPGGIYVRVVIESGLTGFDIGEFLVGPDAKSEITFVDPSTNALSVVWDEQAFSEVRGYPGALQVHRRRLLLGDWKSAPEAWAASAVASVLDFDTGEALDGEAIIETLTASPRERIRHFVPAETLLILTDQAARYVPEGRDSVLTPTFASVFKASPVGASGCVPCEVEQGVAYVDDVESRVVLLTATGAQQSPWALTDITSLVPHFMNTPKELCTTGGTPEMKERYLFVRMENGDIATLFYRADDPIYGWVYWTTNGTVLSTWVVEGVRYALVEREVDGIDTLFLEREDPDCLLDGATEFSSASGGADLAHLEGQEVYIVRGAGSLGAFTVGASGVLSGVPDVGSGNFTAGWSFAVEAETVSPVLLENIKASGPRLRIPRCWVTVKDSGTYKIGGQPRLGYAVAAGDGALPVAVSETTKWHLRGRSPAPTVTIGQDEASPSPLTVLSVTMEVSS